MRRIGLLGGMSWESTSTYYAKINQAVRDLSGGGLRSADLLLRSFDFQTVVDLQKADQWDKAAALLAEAAQSLEAAGADCILICTNTMHLVADQVADRISIPLIHIIDETAHALKAQMKRRPLLLATRYSMEHGFYAERMKAHNIELLVPEASDRARVHSLIFDELCQGVICPKGYEDMCHIITKAKAQGADSFILGCTELGLSLDVLKTCHIEGLMGFDSTLIHAKAAVAFALDHGQDPSRQVA